MSKSESSFHERVIAKSESTFTVCRNGGANSLPKLNLCLPQSSFKLIYFMRWSCNAGMIGWGGWLAGWVGWVVGLADWVGGWWVGWLAGRRWGWG